MSAAVHRLALVALTVVLATACDRSGERDLWKTDFPAGRVSAPTEVAGYWEGDVAMGGIRLLVEPARVTVALRCDGEGRKIAQGSAPMRIETAPSTRMILETDLAGGDDECGFRFIQGNAFAFAVSGPALLDVAFAGTSVSRLRKLADLPGPR